MPDPDPNNPQAQAKTTDESAETLRDAAEQDLTKTPIHFRRIYVNRPCEDCGGTGVMASNNTPCLACNALGYVQVAMRVPVEED